MELSMRLNGERRARSPVLIIQRKKNIPRTKRISSSHLFTAPFNRLRLRMTILLAMSFHAIYLKWHMSSELAYVRQRMPAQTAILAVVTAVTPASGRGTHLDAGPAIL